MQAIAASEVHIEKLQRAMFSLESLLNENDPDYIINAIKYYKSHQKLDEQMIGRINKLLSAL